MVSSLAPTKHTKKLLWCDTGIHDQSLYQTTFDMFQRAGWNIDYRTIADLLDLSDGALLQYDGLAVNLEMEVVRAKPSSLPRKKVLDLIRRYALVPHKTTIMLFPTLGSREVEVALRVEPFFSALGLSSFGAAALSSDAQPESRASARLLVKFLSLPLEMRAFRYDTTLKVARQKGPSLSKQLEAFEHYKGGVFSEFLPLTSKPVDEKLHPLRPLGIYLKSPHNGHQVVCGFSSTTTLFDCHESFQIVPADMTLQAQLKDTVYTFWRQILFLAGSGGSHDKKTIRDQLKDFKEIEYVSKQNERPLMKKKRKVAWMEVLLDAQRQEEKQRRLVEDIYQAGLTDLWISFSPQMYYSKHAKNPKQRNDFESSAAYFVKLLAEYAREHDKVVPRILVGFELANNLYEPHLPKPAALDLYETPYQDVPSPFSRNFWQNELIDPLKTFVGFWETIKQEHGVGLSGVVLDLELYCRKTTGLFLSTMGLCQEVRSGFTQEAERFCLGDAPSFIQKLSMHKSTNEYIRFLGDKSDELASWMAKEIKLAMGSTLIGCYAPFAQQDYFYRALYKNFAREHGNILLFTFNSQSHSVRELFSQLAIDGEHIGVVMLSKLQDGTSARVVDEAMRHHDGLWLNRFSRMVDEQDPDAWFYIEQPWWKGSEERRLFFDALSKHPAR
jgi:hypothetical protein